MEACYGKERAEVNLERTKMMVTVGGDGGCFAGGVVSMWSVWSRCWS